MTVIVVGGGKVGYYLAKTLLEHGHEANIIELDRELCHRIANDLDIPVVCGDGTTIHVLNEAGAQDADALISVTGQDENNLVACQIAKRSFGIKRTVARVNNPKNAKIMKDLGVDIPISSTDNIARLIEREVDTAAIKQLMQLNRGETSLSEIELPQDFKFSGKKLMELRMPEESVVVSISRGDQIIIPRGNTMLLAGDKIMVISKNSVLHALCRKFGLDKPD
ncbi:MAG: TrkA family potassium uptake protein [Acetanaerobacterium sp.]